MLRPLLPGSEALYQFHIAQLMGYWGRSSALVRILGIHQVGYGGAHLYQTPRNLVGGVWGRQVSREPI